MGNLTKPNKEQARTKIKKKAMVNAMKENFGIVLVACQKVGISRVQHYEWLRKDEKYRRAVEETSDLIVDFAEAKMLELMNDKNPQIVIFALKTKGRARGYIERQELDHTGGIHVTIKETIEGEDAGADNGMESDKKTGAGPKASKK